LPRNLGSGQFCDHDWLGKLAGFAGGFFAFWIGALGFDVAFILGFVRHESEQTTNAILAAAGVVAILSLLAAAIQHRFLAWLCGFFACLASMYLGLWSLTGGLAQTLLP